MRSYNYYYGVNNTPSKKLSTFWTKDFISFYILKCFIYFPYMCIIFLTMVLGGIITWGLFKIDTSIPSVFIFPLYLASVAFLALPVSLFVNMNGILDDLTDDNEPYIKAINSINISD